MSEALQILDKHNEKVDPIITSQTNAQPVDTGTGDGATKNEKVDPTVTSQADAQPLDTSMGNGLAKALIGGVVGVVVGTLAAALANKKTAQSINSAVKSVENAVKGAAGNVAKGINDTVKGAGDIKDTGENVKSSVESTVDTVKDTVEDAKPSAHQSLKLYEERLVADTRQVKTASVTIGKHVETQMAHICVPVRKERLVVEQIPVDAGTPVTPGTDFQEGEIARLEIYEETADVQKQTFVREEVSVRKEVDHNTIEVEDTIRREELDLEIQDSNGINNTETL